MLKTDMDYAQVKDSTYSSDLTVGTFMIYIFLDSQVTQTTYLIGSADTVGNTRFFALAIENDDEPMIFVRNNGTTNNIHGDSLHTLRWYLLTYQSTGSAYRIAINDTLSNLSVDGGANDGNWIASVDQRDNFTIGALERSAQIRRVNGVIGFVRAYDRVLSIGEISSIFHSRGSINVEGCIGDWRMDEKPNGTSASATDSIYDISGQGIDLDLVNTPVYTATPTKLFGRRR